MERNKSDYSGELDKEELIRENGQLVMADPETNHRIHLLSIIGEIEGHECLSSNLKTTKYEHVLPQLAEIENNRETDGLLILINTVGGDVEAGLAISEMIASLSIPSVSLVLGGSHSIGVPLAVSATYSFIVPTATMMIHPVRLNGMIIGVRQSYDYFKRIQDRITGFVTGHSSIREERLLELMMDTQTMTRDVGSILVGSQAVEEGLIHEIGGIDRAVRKLHELIEKTKRMCYNEKY
ncbi:MAG: ATP-dependent Clp protease proteolytic subunit [Lachnospiraceae bacterium]|nr:ATP-dependent Clp protease proteolytic subunit [Lachnospiraceae bacterium]